MLHGADARLVGREDAASVDGLPSSPGRGAVVPWRASSSRPPVDCRTGRAGRGPATAALLLPCDGGAPVERSAFTDDDWCLTDESAQLLVMSVSVVQLRCSPHATHTHTHTDTN